MSELSVEEAYTRLVRPLSEKEYGDLRISIKTHGLLVPITVNQAGVILDGHNRHKICQELGIKPVVIRKEFQSPTAEKLFVIECNLRRRHLTDIEKVELGMQLESLEAELAKDRQSEAGKIGVDVREGRVVSNEPTLNDKGKASDIIAKKVGLSPTTYHRGKTVLEKGTDKMKEEVKAGKKTVSAAYEEIKGRDNKEVKRSRDPVHKDFVTLPEELYDQAITAIQQAKETGEKQLVMRHDGHRIIMVGKQIAETN